MHRYIWDTVPGTRVNVLLAQGDRLDAIAQAILRFQSWKQEQDGRRLEDWADPDTIHSPSPPDTPMTPGELASRVGGFGGGSSPKGSGPSNSDRATPPDKSIVELVIVRRDRQGSRKPAPFLRFTYKVEEGFPILDPSILPGKTDKNGQATLTISRGTLFVYINEHEILKERIPIEVRKRIEVVLTD